MAEVQPGNSLEKRETFSLIGSDYAVFCRIAHSEWRQVISHGKEGVTVLAESLSFQEVWDYDLSKPRTHLSEVQDTYPWPDLLPPLPDHHIDTWGYAMTYPGHQEEVRLEDSFHFRKFASAASANSDVVFRPYLDYEVEVGVLMQRGNDQRFGYLLINDLTDRGIQVRTYDADNMAPGFSKAKSFEGALQIGSLMVIGDREIWEGMEVELRVNGEKRQHLIAADCLLRPEQIHDEIFAAEEEREEWALAATGTTEGVQFYTPSIWQKIGLLVASGFSREGAATRWLEQLSFLQPGDRIDIHSALLGRSSATVVDR